MEQFVKTSKSPCLENRRCLLFSFLTFECFFAFMINCRFGYSALIEVGVLSLSLCLSLFGGLITGLYPKITSLPVERQ